MLHCTHCGNTFNRSTAATIAGVLSDDAAYACPTCGMDESGLEEVCETCGVTTDDLNNGLDKVPHTNELCFK